jgi:azurin
MSCRPKNLESALLLVRMHRFRSSATVSIKVRSGCPAITADTCAAHFSSGDTLPPRGFGAAFLLSRQRCSHLTVELTLTWKRSAASCRDAPIATASITRSRKSPE